MIHICTKPFLGTKWLKRYQKKRPTFCCVMGFTDTGLYPGISAAGRSVSDRKTTAIADLEFLIKGHSSGLEYPLPPLIEGASPVYISRAIASQLQWPVVVMNAGSHIRPPFPCIDLGGEPAKNLSSGNALETRVVMHLFQAGLEWGERLASFIDGYIILSECVVGGTTTALGILSALGYDANSKVNSSHKNCNHPQKWSLVKQGLEVLNRTHSETDIPLPFRAVAALGDPMQIAVAGLTLKLSQSCGVMLAGGTQMLAVYALVKAIAQEMNYPWNPDSVVVGTTPWVVNDATGDTLGLAQDIGNVCLMTSDLNFKSSKLPELAAYEQGFVKEGVGAGGCAIGAHLHGNWSGQDILAAVEHCILRQQTLEKSQARHNTFPMAVAS